MKYIRFLLGLAVCTLACYGGYQIYEQHYPHDTKMSEDFMQKLSDAGIVTNTANDSDNIPSLFQVSQGVPANHQIIVSAPPANHSSSYGSNHGSPQTSRSTPPAFMQVDSFAGNAGNIVPDNMTSPTVTASGTPNIATTSSTAVTPLIITPTIVAHVPDIPQVPPREVSASLLSMLQQNAAASNNEMRLPPMMVPPTPPQVALGNTPILNEPADREVIPAPPIVMSDVMSENIIPPDNTPNVTTLPVPQNQVAANMPHSVTEIPGNAFANNNMTPAQNTVLLNSNVLPNHFATMPNAPLPIVVDQTNIVPVIPSPQAAVATPELAIASTVVTPSFVPSPVIPLPDTGTEIMLTTTEPNIMLPAMMLPTMPSVTTNPTNVPATVLFPSPPIPLPPVDDNISALSQSAEIPVTPGAFQATLGNMPSNAQQITQVNHAITPLPVVSEESVTLEVINKVVHVGKFIEQGDIKDGYAQLSELYFSGTLTPEERQYVARHLDMIAGNLHFSKRFNQLEPLYTLKEGETIESVAAKYHITPELLRKVNRIQPNETLETGTVLKVIRGPLDVRVYPNNHEMVILSQDKYVCRFPICTGLRYAGQTGKFSVQDKKDKPIYDMGFGQGNIPAGDPDNPLGDFWIEFSEKNSNLGLHGTNKPEFVGTDQKAGGVFGLNNRDIKEVYDMVIVGSNVTVIR